MMRLALLGDPVAHSKSPALHEAALAALDIEGSYEARRTDAAGVVTAVEEIRNGALVGANVTMPLKAAALKAVDTASLEAIRAAAVNTLYLGAGAVRGENTDIGGLTDIMKRLAAPADAPVLVLGSGGAAGAAVIAFGDRELTVSARRDERARALLDRTGADGRVVAWGSPVTGAVVVNATPLGMHGETLPSDALREASALIDLAYGDRPTPAVEFTTGRAPVADGIDVLVAQAARSFGFWTGRVPPIEVMEAAARAG